MAAGVNYFRLLWNLYRQIRNFCGADHTGSTYRKEIIDYKMDGG